MHNEDRALLENKEKVKANNYGIQKEKNVDIKKMLTRLCLDRNIPMSFTELKQCSHFPPYSQDP